MKRILQGLLLAVVLSIGETVSAPSDGLNSCLSHPTPQQDQASIDNSTEVHNIPPLPSSPSTTKKRSKSKSSTKATSSSTIKKKPTKTTVSSSASASLRRIKKEYKDAVQMGICYDWVKGRLITSATTKRDGGDCQLICLGPLATNLRHWHFSFRGVKNSLYESGIYHGVILLPKNYPATPPRVQLWTPSGRFQPHTDICLSASAFHPESWTPRWTVLSLVHALRLHMLTNPQEIGGIMSNAEETLEYARRSLTWRVSWVTGNTRVIVDHSKLLEQGALRIHLGGEEAEKSSSIAEEVIHIPDSSEVSFGVERKLIAEGQDESAQSVPTTEEPSDEHQHAVEAMETLEKAQAPRAKLKQKTKSAKRKKEKKSKNLKTSVLEVPARPLKSRLRGALILTMSAIFATPFRAGLSSMFFLLFLGWLITVPL